MRKIRLFIFVFSVAIFFLPLIGHSQQSTSGPIPPPGIDRGLRADTKSQVVISNVPSYIWHHGCGPTAAGMAIGYWDQFFPFLVEGDATTQTVGANKMMTDDSEQPGCGYPNADHYQDYSCPIDNGSNILPDQSEPGSNPHANNCLGDFMYTSRSSVGNAYGWSWFSHVYSAFVGYINFVATGMDFTVANYIYDDFTFEDYKNEINNGRPVVLLVDTDGNGITDHFVTGIGYDDVDGYYGIYDTWDHNLHWYYWHQLSTASWGIYGVTTLDFGIPGLPIFGDDSCRFKDTDGDEFYDAGDTVEVIIFLTNYGSDAANVNLTISSDYGDMEYLTEYNNIGFVAGAGNKFDNTTTPLVYIVPDVEEALFTDFHITVEATNEEVSQVFDFEQQLGRTEILIVDDDRGDNFEDIYTSDLYDQGKPSKIWCKQTDGSPAGSYLNEYNRVFWFTGDSADDYFTTDDITAMKDYLDNGGNLLLSGQGLAAELHQQDSVFLYDYLHGLYGGSIDFSIRQLGCTGTPLGDDLDLYLGSWHAEDLAESVIPVNGAAAEFKSLYNPSKITAISYSGNHRSILLTWCYEQLQKYSTTYTPRDTVMARILSFFPKFVCGDINNNGAINIIDITYLIAYLYKSGPAPKSMWAADPNGNGAINILDITYLISFLYKNGPAPVCL
ncbi:MAG: dockerin type I domain-containing protein [Candidatus Zixiibacteriota bacterium]